MTDGNIDVQKEADELITLLDEFDKVKEMPNVDEKIYFINREARRRAAKRDRATRKRDPRV